MEVTILLQSIFYLFWHQEVILVINLEMICRSNTLFLYNFTDSLLVSLENIFKDDGTKNRFGFGTSLCQWQRSCKNKWSKDWNMKQS